MNSEIKNLKLKMEKDVLIKCKDDYIKEQLSYRDKLRETSNDYRMRLQS